MPEQALGPYLRAVRRNWLLVVAITLVTGAVAAATVLRSAATYQATATVLVSPLAQGDPNFVDTGAVLETGEPVRTIQTAAALIDSLPAAQTTAIKMGRGWTTGRVQSATSVVPLGESDILNVTAQAHTAAQAITLANTFAQAAVRSRADVVQRNIGAQLSELNLRLSKLSGAGIANASLAQQLATRIAALHAAQIGGGDPTLSVTSLAKTGSLVGSPHWLIILLSLIGGLAIGSVAALAVEFFNRSVRDLDEIERLFPAPVLAAVSHVKRGEQGDGLRPAAFPPTVFEQIRMLRVQLANHEASRVVMLTSPGVGDGKTTLATALAAAFSEAGERVILMDLDLRKPDVVSLLGLEQRRTATLVDTTLRDMLIEVSDLPGVQVLPAPRGGVTASSTMLARLPELLVEAKAQASHVIIDAAPVGVASESLQLAKMSDQVVMAVRPGHTSRQSLVLARDLLTRASAPVVGVVAVAYGTTNVEDAYSYGYGYRATTGEGATGGTVSWHPGAHAESA